MALHKYPPHIKSYEVPGHLRTCYRRLHAPVALQEVIIRGPFFFSGELEQGILSNPYVDKSVLTLRI